MLVLLDEATAALDARAEHELFERYSSVGVPPGRFRAG